MCENPGYGYSTEGDKIEADLPPVPADINRSIDLRGAYRPQGREFIVEVPEDLVRNGIRVPEHAVVTTPGWGDLGRERYLRAVELDEGRETFLDFSRTIED